MPVRWVGFDMDECIGSVMPLYPYVYLLPHCFKKQNVAGMFQMLADAMYTSERTGKTWLIRPAIFDALVLVWKAYSTGQIKGAFLYSNNSGELLVKFIAHFLNVSIQRIMKLSYIPDVFQMSAWNGIPCRRTYGLTKSFESIQTCLRAHGLPECTSERDLLFFDDMLHVLQLEIPHYVKVTPYFNHTPAILVAEAFSHIGNTLSCAKWSRIATKSIDMQIGDFKRPDNQYIPTPQSVEDRFHDVRMFSHALHTFLNG